MAVMGHRTVCADIDEKRVRQLQGGHSHIYEPRLEEVLQHLVANGLISFTTDVDRAVRDANVVVLAVPSPAMPDGEPDTSPARAAAATIAANLNHHKTILIKSTLPTGADGMLRGVFAKHGVAEDRYDLIFNPEFLREGSGMEDVLRPHRIVVGGANREALDRVKELYRPLLEGQYEMPLPAGLRRKASIPYVETDIATAQIIKYASNTYLATRVSFVNELVGLCEQVGADAGKALKAVGLDDRIGAHYLEPGLGFGGPCLEKDLGAMIHIASKADYEPLLLSGVRDRNSTLVGAAVSRIAAGVGGSLKGAAVTVFGVAFKEGTNDVRNSTAVLLIRNLLDAGAAVRCHDELVTAADLALVEPRAELEGDPYEAVAGADMLVLAHYAPYNGLEFERLAQAMASARIYDTRRRLGRPQLERSGFALI